MAQMKFSSFDAYAAAIQHADTRMILVGREQGNWALDFFPVSYSLGTKNKSLQRNPDGSLTLYAGAKSPGKDKEPNWLPAPAGHFSLYIRAYWGKQGILDGSWKPPAVDAIH
jgi:hypothetical protein